MLEGQTTAVRVSDTSQVGEARRAVAAVSQRLALDETTMGGAAIVATELATNLVKHAGGGEILVHGVAGGIEIMALDRGPGMDDVAAALRDGYSTTGTQGNGLGAVRRLASGFDIYSVPGQGTAILARLHPRRVRPEDGARLEVGAVSVPKQGEALNGDGWAHGATASGGRLLVVDGLGHGQLASEAAHEALLAFRRAGDEPPAAAVETCHLALRSTRGAAVAVAGVDLDRRVVHFAGIGNVAGSIWNGGLSHHMVSLNGTAGQGTVRPREFTYVWPPSGLLVLASDGLATRWTFEDYPGLARRDPALVAGVLYRDFTRGRDDVTVVVARETRP